MTPAELDWLWAEGLLEARPNEPCGSLAQACHLGVLRGGLSLASGLRPDEAVGPLAATAGGQASNLKVLDSRDRPRPELIVSLGGQPLSWRVDDVPALIDQLNRALEADRSARALVVLGEWEGMLQVWSIDKGTLRRYRRSPFGAWVGK